MANRIQNTHRQRVSAAVSDPESLLIALSLRPSSAPAVHHETTRIFQALRRCLELRDKYMGCSLQRLGDNPQDFDDEDLPPHPESGPYYEATAGDAIPPSEEPRKFAKWRIYPRPPPPRWHWTDTSQGQVPEHHDKERIVQEMEEFEFEKCEIPGACDKGWTFKMDDKGVYQIYTKTALEGSSSEAKTCKRSILDSIVLLKDLQHPARGPNLNSGYLRSGNTIWISTTFSAPYRTGLPRVSHSED
jgi:hypothetical protein